MPATIEELLPDPYLQYGMLLIYDARLVDPGCDYTEDHDRQGFARRDGRIYLSTIMSDCYASIRLIRGPYEGGDHYERVVRIPLVVRSKEIVVEGLFEDRRRTVEVEPGQYYVTVAHRKGHEPETVLIDLYLQPALETFPTSAILVADSALNPPSRLIETAEPGYIDQ